MLRKATSLLLFSVLVLYISVDVKGQDRTVSGVVTTASDGEPLAGVSVVIQGTTRGTATNAEGEYTLSVPQGNNTLVFSFVGFIPKEVEVNNRSEINVVLESDIQQLSDVVVVGYGSQIKRDLTGNIASVTGEEISDVPVNSFESAIQGRAAGVFVNAGNGKLGQEIKIRIRGTSSISASAQPLYVIDGVPVTSASLSNTDNETNPLATLNTSNIESIEILKDASAAAIYGSRGSNGVVLITTKRGNAGRTQVDVNYQTSFSEPARKRDFMRSEEYINYFLEAAENRAVYDYNRRGNPDGYASEQAAIDDWVSYTSEDVFDYYAQGVDWRNNPIDFDWQNQAYQDAYGHQFDASVSGGNEQTRFFVSGAFSNENGILIDNEFTRVNSRVNVDHEASEKFRVGLNLSVNRTVNNRLGNDNLFETPMQMVAQMPLSPFFADNPDEDGYQATDEYNLNTYYDNALHITENATFDTKVNRTFGNVYAEYSFSPNLFVRSEFGADILNQNEAYAYNNDLAYYVGAEGSSYSAFTEALNYTTNNYLNFQNTFAQNHNVEVVAGLSANIYQQDFTSVEGENFPNSNFDQIQNAADIISGDGGETEYSFLSYFARANYKFRDRYLLKLSARVDGSSRFGSNNRYGFFPSVSGGWIISDEAFMADNNAISFLKFRASYGVTGNANLIENFPSLGLYEGVGYAGASALQPSQTPNPDLKWETTTQIDVGIDYGFFDGRITGEIDYYIKDTDDLLLDVNVPGTTGFTTQTRNVGELKNQGFEFVVNTRNIARQDFLWTSGFNIAFNRNEVGDLDGQVIEGGYINQAVEGEPIGVFYSYEYAGVDPQTGDALFYINDVGEDGFGVIDHSTGTTTNSSEANQVVIGNPNPDFIGGFNNKFSYKGFDLNALFQFVYGNKIYNGGGIFMSSGASYFDNQTADQLDRWQNPGDQTDVPEPRLGLGNGNVQSSRYLSDGSYLRLKALTFAYNLPSSLLDKANIRRARLFVTGSNLLTFTDYDGWDPEVTADYLDGNLALGNDFYSAPQPRTIAIGINLGL